MAYPSARRGDTVDDYHGTKVADPYRWLEDLDSTETRAWIDAEVALATDYLAKLPGRARLQARLTELWNYERFGVPSSKHGRYFWSHNTGLQNQSVLFTAASLRAEPRPLIDPNTLSSDGTVALSHISVTEDGVLLAYAAATAGSDWMDIRVRPVAGGPDLPDVVRTRESGAAWARDRTGFYYVAYDRAKDELKSENRFPKVRFHKLGTTQEQDVTLYDRPDQPDWSFDVQVSEDGRWLELLVSSSKAEWSQNLLYVRDLGRKSAAWIPIADTFDASVWVVGTIGSRLYIRTDRQAPRGRIVTVDAAHPERWDELVPETAATLRDASLVHDQLILQYLEDAHARVSIHDLRGRKLRDVALPGLGTAVGFGGERRDKETFYAFQNTYTPATIYRYDLITGESAVFRAPKVAFDPSRFETEQTFATSKDGTRVPLFVSHRKGLARDGQSPTWLYGYGGFDIDITPTYHPMALVWMEAGGVYVDAVLRGGGEYGEAWHRAGRMAGKQNVFDDFIAAAEHLVAERWTSVHNLAINGASNGGLLVGAVLTQRPDVAGAAIAQVGVMDMLRFQKFTIGWSWAAEFGSSDDPDQFAAIMKYSPLHNIKPGVSYPPTLITTADHDDRVFPAHSFKFAAALQAAQAGPAPIVIRIETRAGHGAGKPTTKQIEEAADILAFMARALGMTI
jgi:prolyl oligopeptidase